MSNRDLRALVLQFVTRPNYQPVKPKVIAKKLELEDAEKKKLKRTLSQLVKDGLISWGQNHLVVAIGGSTAEGRATNLVMGTFRRAKDGHGYVRPPQTQAGTAPQSDIYVAAQSALDASTGDRVLVRLDSRQRRLGQPQGAVVEVITRASRRFVGTYFEKSGTGYVRIDGTVFNEPVLVGDPGAKSVKPNDKVVVEIIRFPSFLLGGEGVVTEVLGAKGAPGVDTQMIIHEYALPTDFPEEVLEAARVQAEEFVEEVPADRADLTHMTIITIDPADARDFDDAISLTRTDKMHWELGVHIADVAHFVPEGSPQDQEARDRGTSVYLPDKVIPMLPEIISNGLASLQPNKVRYSRSVFMEFGPSGEFIHARVQRSAIRSCRRFNYEEVDDFLLHPARWKTELAPAVYQLLAEMRELAKILRARRAARGAIELSMPEVKVELDENGRVSGARRVDHTESHQIIEEFMLSANEAVAELLAGAGFGFLRRIHAYPDSFKLKQLTEFVRELDLPAGNLEDRFEIQRILQAVQSRPEAPAVNFAVLRSMQRAAYSPIDEGHYALASKCYCHFTSPIRRYPDLTIHRLCDLLAANKHNAPGEGALVALGEHCSDRERRAESAERDLTRIKLLYFFSGRIGEEMDAVITGVESFGVFAQGLALPVDGRIHISALSDDVYRYDSTARALVGYRSGSRLQLGDTVRVRVAHVDVDRRELDFQLVRRLGRKKLAAIPKKAAKGKRPTGKKSSQGPRKPGKNSGPRSGGKRHKGR